MLTQIKNARFYLQAKLGQRGAEMVEYAIVLACIAAVGVAFYTISGPASNQDTFDTFVLNLQSLFLNIGNIAKDIRNLKL